MNGLVSNSDELSSIVTSLDFISLNKLSIDYGKIISRSWRGPIRSLQKKIRILRQCGLDVSQLEEFAYLSAGYFTDNELSSLETGKDDLYGALMSNYPILNKYAKYVYDLIDVNSANDIIYVGEGGYGMVFLGVDHSITPSSSFILKFAKESLQKRGNIGNLIDEFDKHTVFYDLHNKFNNPLIGVPSLCKSSNPSKGYLKMEYTYAETLQLLAIRSEFIKSLPQLRQIIIKDHEGDEIIKSIYYKILQNGVNIKEDNNLFRIFKRLTVSDTIYSRFHIKIGTLLSMKSTT